ncbi:MAG TPA: hypothetical protein PK625_02115, partial [Spirochaetales bacterium]|nr:hypothetical protein [Spirochaetales bacterium]
TPVVSADATLTWGMDLDTGATGFLNEYSADVTIPFAVEDAEATGEGVHGYIALTGITFELFDDPVVGGFNGINDVDGYGSPASLEAKIVSGPLYAMVYSQSDLEFNAAADLLDGEVEGLFDANTYGTQIGYDSEMYDVGLIINSKGDWTTNVDNEYGMGIVASLTFVPDTLALDAGFSYDLTDVTKDMGFWVSVPVTVAGFAITPAADFYIADGADMAFDARLDLGYDITDATNVAVAVYYGGDEDLEMSIDFYEDGGFVENLYFGFGFGYYNALETAVAATWDTYVDLTYTIAMDGDYYVMPYAHFSTDNTNVIALNLGVEAFLIPNTTFTLDWDTTDLGNVNGILTFATNVSL